MNKRNAFFSFTFLKIGIISTISFFWVKDNNFNIFFQKKNSFQGPFSFGTSSFSDYVRPKRKQFVLAEMCSAQRCFELDTYRTVLLFQFFIYSCGFFGLGAFYGYLCIFNWSTKSRQFERLPWTKSANDWVAEYCTFHMKGVVERPMNNSAWQSQIRLTS